MQTGRIWRVGVVLLQRNTEDMQGGKREFHIHPKHKGRELRTVCLDGIHLSLSGVKELSRHDFNNVVDSVWPITPARVETRRSGM